jgi:Glycosyl transferase family 2
MKLVLTVLARDEADVIDAQIAYHLNAGVDFVIATDNNSRDGTREILETYAREGYLHLIHEPAEGLRQGDWVTRMARLAASQFGADWVINTDADEFWWPRRGSLKEVLTAVPPRYGIVHAFWRCFVPRPDDDQFFADRMTIRLSQHAPINDPSSVYRPVTKVAHRADPDVVVGRGNHGLIDSPLLALTTWYPIEVLHFPLRSHAQWLRKVELQGEAFTKHIERAGTGYHLSAYSALQGGKIDEQYESLLVPHDAVARGLDDRTLARDTRLRDALRTLRFSQASGGREFALPRDGDGPLWFERPSASEDAAYAVEAAVLGEADAVRLQRRLDALEQRLAALES